MADSIFAIDVGSSSIKGVVATSANEDGGIQVIAASHAPTSGVRRGEIVDSGQVVKVIRHLVNEIKGAVDVDLAKAIVNVGGGHVGVARGRGVVTVSRADQIISENDVERVIASSQTVSLPLNREIVHIIPREFIVDGEGGIKNAVGMRGTRLEVDALLVYAFSPHIKTLMRTLSEAGLGEEGAVISSLAAASCILSDKEKEIGSLLIDIGAQTTDIVVFEEGQPIHVAVLPIGSFHISNDIAIGLRVEFDTAERLKLLYGQCNPESLSKRDMITPDMVDVPLDIAISKKELSQIVEARTSEIFDLVQDQLRAIGRSARLPGGGALIGGGAKTAGIVDFAKQKLQLSCRVGQFRNVKGLVGKIDPLFFAPAVGLAKWGFETNESPGVLGTSFIEHLYTNIKKVFRGFLP